MKFCSQCGTQLAEEARFCKTCGSSQDFEDVSQQTQIQQPVPPQVQQQIPPQVQQQIPPQVQEPIPPQVQEPIPPQVQEPIPPQVQQQIPPQAQDPIPPVIQEEDPINQSISEPFQSEINQNEAFQQESAPYIQEESPKKKSKLPYILMVAGVAIAGIGFYFTTKPTEIPQETVVPDIVAPTIAPEIVEVEPEELEEDLEESETIPDEPEIEPEIEEIPPEPVQKGVDMSSVERSQVYVANAHASSTFPDWEHKTYDAGRTLDGDIETAWVENVSGLGIGQWVEHQLGGSVPVQEIQFYNGYGGVYEKNGRLTQVSVSLSNGETFLYPVEGHWNTIVLPYAINTQWVRLTIVDAVSSGDQDTCISEIVIYNKSDSEPTPTVPNWEIGIYGDMSKVTQAQASAMLDKIQQLESDPYNNCDYFYPDSGQINHYANIFDGGDGVPVLYLHSEQTSDLVSYSDRIWVWDGSKMVEPAWNRENRLVNHFPIGISTDDKGKYFLHAAHTIAVTIPPLGGEYLIGFEKGQMSHLESGYFLLLPSYTLDSLADDLNRDYFLKDYDLNQYKTGINEYSETVFEIGDIQNYRLLSRYYASMDPTQVPTGMATTHTVRQWLEGIINN